MKHFLHTSYMVFLFGLITVLPASAQKNKKLKTQTDTVELTKVDISKLTEFDAQFASVFGITLFMTQNEVRKADKKYPFLKLKQDKFNHLRYYLYDNDTGETTLGYLKWYPKDSGLMEIVLYPEITKHLKGQTCNILTKDCMNPESDIYKSFLRKPVDEDVILDIPSINLKTTRYYYPSLSLIIEVQQSGEETKYNLILFKF